MSYIFESIFVQQNMSLAGAFGVLPDRVGECFCIDMFSIDKNCCDVGI